MRRDEINVDYILRLLSQLVGAGEEQKIKVLNSINNILSSDAVLRSKRELIEKFITKNIPNITDGDEVAGEFDTFWSSERAKAFEAMCLEEGLMTDKLQKLINDYLFTGRKPRSNELAATLIEKPKILERDSILTKINKKLNSFIETFIEGV